MAKSAINPKALHITAVLLPAAAKYEGEKRTEAEPPPQSPLLIPPMLPGPSHE